MVNQWRRPNGPIGRNLVFLPDEQMTLVHKRPHLHEFLEAVSSKYETHVFTAAIRKIPVLSDLGLLLAGVFNISCRRSVLRYII
jgi:NLI interacting factor-like phosphatase